MYNDGMKRAVKKTAAIVLYGLAVLAAWTASFHWVNTQWMACDPQYFGVQDGAEEGLMTGLSLGVMAIAFLIATWLNRK